MPVDVDDVVGEVVLEVVGEVVAVVVAVVVKSQSVKSPAILAEINEFSSSTCAWQSTAACTEKNPWNPHSKSPVAVFVRVEMSNTASIPLMTSEQLTGARRISEPLNSPQSISPAALATRPETLQS